MKALDLQEWMSEQGYIENGFEFAGIANGMKLFDCDDAEQKRRVKKYRELHPIKAKREEGVKYPDSKTAFGLVMYGVDMFATPDDDKARYEQHMTGTAI